MPTKPAPQVNEADYVVVGAGSAGCALAARLAGSGASVVLIEAGGSDDTMMFRKPGMITMMHADPRLKAKFDWGYYHAPQEHLLGRKIPATRGKVLGGSSSVNGMIFVRGHKADFDGWAAEGNTGWAYDDVLATYKKLENWEGGADDFRGAGGPVQVIENHDVTDAANSFVEAGVAALGVKQTPDYNGAEQAGMHVIQESTRAGLRSSTSRAYLHDNPQHAVSIQSGVTAAKVVIEGGRATGVQVIDGAPVAPSAPRARSSCPRAHSAHRSSCSSPASARPTCWPRSASPSSRTCRSARTSTTTSSSRPAGTSTTRPTRATPCTSEWASSRSGSTRATRSWPTRSSRPAAS